MREDEAIEAWAELMEQAQRISHIAPVDNAFPAAKREFDLLARRYVRLLDDDHPEDDDQCCIDCRYFKERNGDGQFKRGDCRRYPPTSTDNQTFFPQVIEVWWCGEFKKKQS